MNGLGSYSSLVLFTWNIPQSLNFGSIPIYSESIDNSINFGSIVG